MVLSGKLPNENVGAALTATFEFEPNENVLFGANASLLPNENWDFGVMNSLAPFDTSRDCSQHSHLDLVTSLLLRHAEHSHWFFCLSTMALNTLSTGLNAAGVALVEDAGNEPKLNVDFGTAVLLTVTLLEDAFGLAPPQQAHFASAYENELQKCNEVHD